MKALITTALLTATFCSNLMAQDKTCYPINQEDFNRICVALENPRANDSKAVVEVYRYEKLIATIAGKRVYNPQSRDCTTLPFCFRRYEALRVVPEIRNQNIDFEVIMRGRGQTTTTCLNGTVTVTEQGKTMKLDVECPRVGWEVI